MPILKYLDFPKVPEHLYAQVAEIIKKPDELERFTGMPYTPYQLMPIDEGCELETWLLENLPIKRGDVFHVHVMIDRIVQHKDWGRKYSLNYIFETGGNQVVTGFYDDDKNVLEKHILEPHRWHTFNSEVFHDVVGITLGEKRIAIVIGLAHSLTDNSLN
jgi:hypothetical protein